MSDTSIKSPQVSDVGDADLLLVEDDEVDAELTLAALKKCGVRHVKHVMDGSEALDYIASTGVYVHQRLFQQPRLILLDLGLRQIGGLQVLQQLKADPHTKGIPVVVLTGARRDIELMESYALGVNSYVIKPTDPKEFSAVVAAIGHYWLNVNQLPPPH